MNCEKKILRIALFLMLILSTCTQFPSPIIADPQCAPPCWQGIIPGKTTETELLSILNNLSIFDEEPVISNPRPLFDKAYISTIMDGKTDVYFGLLNDVVIFIGLSPTYIYSADLGITLGEAVEVFGEPEFVVNTTTMGPSKFLWFNFGIEPWTLISMMDLKKGVEFRFQIPLLSENPSQEIKPNIELLEASFFDPTVFELLADNGMFSSLNYIQIKEGMHPWAGYGDIESKYPYIPFSEFVP